MVSSNNLTMQGVTVTPRFAFGVNGQISHCLSIVEDKKLVYVAGHNVILYHTDDMSQLFIPGSSDADAINFIHVSTTGKYLAICEKAERRAQVQIYDFSTLKTKKKIPSEEF